MTRLAVKDGLLDAQTLRAAGTTAYGGADVGECLTTARRVRGTDLASWHTEWSTTARHAEQLAEHCETTGARESARLAYFRASTYYRTAGVMLLAPPAEHAALDERLVASNAAQTRAFRAGAALLDTPPQILPFLTRTPPCPATSSPSTQPAGRGRR